MIITSYLKAVGQIGDPRFLRVLALGLGLTIALLFGFTVLFAWTVGLIVPDSFSLPWIGEITWIDNLASLAVIPVMLLASVFLMVPVAAAFIGIIFAFIFAPFAPFIFWAVNGLMLGREYATLTARRRMSRAQVHAFRKRHSITIWLAGICMAVPLTIPVMNLIVPILGVAGFTHLINRLKD